MSRRPIQVIMRTKVRVSRKEERWPSMRSYQTTHQRLHTRCFEHTACSYACRVCIYYYAYIYAVSSIQFMVMFFHGDVYRLDDFGFDMCSAVGRL